MSVDDEFRLHLYDKLWENIVHKENRLWTFLSFYGAAVGLVLGTRTAEPFRLEAAFVILVLTYWAAELVIDSDWWSVRNRLMVQGIEKKSPGAGEGIIPTFYQQPRFSSESLHSISLLVFTLVGIGTYWTALGRMADDGMLDPVEQASLAVLLYVGIILAAVRCEHVREQRVRDYFSTFLDLESQGKQRADIDEEKNRLVPIEIANKRKQTWRIWILLIYGIATAVLLWYYHEPLFPAHVCVLAILVALTIGTYVGLYVSFRHVAEQHVGFWPKGYRGSYGFLAVLFSATALFFFLTILWQPL